MAADGARTMGITRLAVTEGGDFLQLDQSWLGKFRLCDKWKNLPESGFDSCGSGEMR